MVVHPGTELAEIRPNNTPLCVFELIEYHVGKATNQSPASIFEAQIGYFRSPANLRFCSFPGWEIFKL